MWKLIGRPVCSRRGPEPIPGGSPRSMSNDADDRAAVPARRASLQLGGRSLRRVAGQEREHAQPIGSDGVELLDGPVVPRRVTGALQLGVVDRKAERERSVDHRGPQAVAVHVLEPQLGSAGTEAVVLDAGAPDRAQLLRDLAVRRDAAAAHHAVLAHPDRLAVPRRPRADRGRPGRVAAATATRRAAPRTGPGGRRRSRRWSRDPCCSLRLRYGSGAWPGSPSSAAAAGRRSSRRRPAGRSR